VPVYTSGNRSSKMQIPHQAVCRSYLSLKKAQIIIERRRAHYNKRRHIAH
jgi:hypothetical protein